MNRHRTRALACILALSLTACTPPPDQAPDPLPTVATTPAAPTSAEPTGHDHDRPTQEQQAIALEAARIMTTWTPATDANRTEAERRAGHLMTAERAEQITAPARPAGGAEWTTAAEAEATSVPEVQLNDRSDTTGVAVTATWTWQTPAGDELPQHGTPVRWYTFEFVKDDPEKIGAYSYQERVQGP